MNNAEKRGNWITLKAGNGNGSEIQNENENGNGSSNM
jgi:hypothetical protein